jgi:hypothetical protein
VSECSRLSPCGCLTSSRQLSVLLPSSTSSSSSACGSAPRPLGSSAEAWGAACPWGSSGRPWGWAAPWGWTSASHSGTGGDGVTSSGLLGVPIAVAESCGVGVAWSSGAWSFSVEAWSERPPGAEL